MILRQSKKLFKLVLCSGRSSLRNFQRPMSDMSEVLFDEIGDVGIATLNRPQVLNALNLNMVQLLYKRLKEWENKMKFVILKGNGGKAFCAGGDIIDVTESAKQGTSLFKEFFYQEYLVNCLIGTYHIPFISLIDGITMGGGVGLSVHGSFRVATERTLFAMPETGIGLFPDVGGSYFLPRLGGNLGMYLALTGFRLKGRDVLRAGVATHVCDSSKLEELLADLTSGKIVYPEDVRETLGNYMETAIFGSDKEFILKSYLPIIQKCFQGDSVEDIIKNLENEGSEWSKKQIDIIEKMSPTSVKITFESQKRGQDLNLQECLIMEYRLTQRCCLDNDFPEGVRALLVDKDNSPKWKPDSLAGVTKEKLDEYFSPLSPDRELKFV
ncbi:3-hydroxyisobutyryl-CoA hydrolase, mitochondrial [Armadillidium vulgare]|nr:3-hydroxyisobutyryl-CoA hydrolase, mitochondrial [Armadillidium vulgare]